MFHELNKKINSRLLKQAQISDSVSKEPTAGLLLRILGLHTAAETIYDIANKESHLPALKTFPINNRAVKRKDMSHRL